MNTIDKIVNYFNPMEGTKRAYIRSMQKHIIKNSGYSDGGASYTKRSLKGFTAYSSSPQSDIDQNLNTLVSRSRSLYMTTPIATAMIKTTKTNVVGSGLKLKARIDYDFLGLSEEESEEWESAVEREFALWADTSMCDSLGINNFYEQQALFFLGQLLNGDGLCLRKYEEPTNYMPYGLRLQLIEADRLSTPSKGTIPNGVSMLQGVNEKNGNKIYNGIEIDNNGKTIAYHFCNQYPYEFGTMEFEPPEWIRVEAIGSETGLRNVLHAFDSERAEQRRGVPMLAPVIESLKQISRYTEAELMAAVISGMFTIFIKTDNPTSELPIGEAIPSEYESVPTNANDYQLGNGTINVLAPNESIQTADPNRPNDGFDKFVNSMAKQIGAACEIPQQLLLKEFNASYSASRAALLEAWKMFKMRRDVLAKNFCQPVYEMFLTEAVANGRIKAKGFFTDPTIRKAWCGADWNGAAAGMIDPVKEVTAAQMRIADGLSTREEETIGLTGGDFIKNAKQLKRENKLLSEAQKELTPMNANESNFGADNGKEVNENEDEQNGL